MEQASYERNSGHRTAKSNSWSGSGQRKRRWSCSVEGGVAESVECSDEVRKRWDTHGDRDICGSMIPNRYNCNNVRRGYVSLLKYIVLRRRH